MEKAAPSAGLHAGERPPGCGHRRLSAWRLWRDPVNNGNNGDIGQRVVELGPRSWLNGSSYGDGRPSRRFGLQFATVPICSGCRSEYGREIAPGQEILKSPVNVELP